MRGRLRDYEYFVCICDKYLHFILNEYFFSICHYLWEVHTSSLFVSQVGGLWAGVRGRLRNYEYFVCFCDKYLYFILNEYFFSICHYLYPKLVGCGQVWEADCEIMSILYVFVISICILFWMSISSVFVIICIPSWWVVARCERQTAGLWVFCMYSW